MTGEAGAAGLPRLCDGSLVLRPVAPADIPRLLTILDEAEVALWWRRTEWERLDERDAETFTIELDHEVAGCIQFTEETDPDYLSAALDIFLATAAQGRGVGSRAMRLLIDWLVAERGHHRLTVDPAAVNERAIHVYERLGFRRVGVMSRYERLADGTWRDGLLMELVTT